MSDVIMIVIMFYCDEFKVHQFIKCTREWEAAEDHTAIKIETARNKARSDKLQPNFNINYNCTLNKMQHNRV